MIDNPFDPGELPFGFVPDNPEPTTWSGLSEAGFPRSIGETGLIGVEAAPNNLIFWAIFPSSSDANYGFAVLESALERTGYHGSDQPGFTGRARLLRVDSQRWPVAVCIVQLDNILVVGVSAAPSIESEGDAQANAVDLAAGASAHLQLVLTGESAPDPVLPDTMIYDAEAAGDFEGWPLASGWTVSEVILRAEEEPPAPIWVPIPDGLPGDFAVEIRMRVLLPMGVALLSGGLS